MRSTIILQDKSVIPQQHSFLQPVLYRDLFVHDYRRFNQETPLHQLKSSLEKNPGLQEHITSANIPCVKPMHDSSIYDIFHFFLVRQHPNPDYSSIRGLGASGI